MVSCEGLPKPLKVAGGLHLSPCPLYVRGEVQGRESAPIHKIPAPRRHNRLELMSPDLPWAWMTSCAGRHIWPHAWSSSVFILFSH
jgi:hypothetical protein